MRQAVVLNHHFANPVRLVSFGAANQSQFFKLALDAGVSNNHVEGRDDSDGRLYSIATDLTVSGERRKSDGAVISTRGFSRSRHAHRISYVHLLKRRHFGFNGVDADPIAAGKALFRR